MSGFGPAATTVGYRGSLSHACSPPSGHPASGFAVRYVHGFCLRLPSDTPFLDMPLPLLGVPLPSDHGGFQVYLFPVFSMCVMPGTRKRAPPQAAGLSEELLYGVGGAVSPNAP
jgi:hypothetical protein